MAYAFADLFKKYKLRAGISTLAVFGNLLAEKGFFYEESVFSRWNKNLRVPRERSILIGIIEIFIAKGGITSIREANMLLESAGQGYLTETELEKITSSPNFAVQRQESIKSFVDFTHLIGKSKLIMRKGWLEKKIDHPESIADHSFRLSVLAMTLADKLGVDRERLTEMAIVHDLGSVITGDLIWSRGSNIDMHLRAKKEEMERKGLAQIFVFELIGKANTYSKLFEEMIERKTQEAIVFWQLDKLEMAIQALEYEKETNKNLDEFFINADLQIHSPLLKEIMNELMKRRKK